MDTVDPWRVLVVDDSADDIELLRDSLHTTGFLPGSSPSHLEAAGPFRGKVELHTAIGGEEALDRLRVEGPFAVLISDMGMPGIDGPALLQKASKVAPETVRVVVTGLRDQGVAAAAINDGHAFRFIRKPVSDEQLAATLSAALQQYLLVTAERRLLSDTLRGAVGVLADILSLTRTPAFGRSVRIRPLVRELGEQMTAERPWELELAATLSQIGLVAVPDDTVQKVVAGTALTPKEIVMYHSYPRVGADLLARIPRMESVAEMIRYQEQSFNGIDGMPGDPRGHALPLGSRVLKVALDYDALIARGMSSSQAIQELESRTGRYDAQVLEALRRVRNERDRRRPIAVPLAELHEGAVLAEDVVIEEGSVMIAMGHGQPVTAVFLSRIQNSLSEVARRRTVAVLEEA